jgi:hypothetical protein
MFLSSESESACESENESENENESIVNGKDEIGELLKLSGGSRIEDCSDFSGRKLRNVIRIEDSVEIVGEEDFKGDESLKEVIFSSSNQLREICGFWNCTSLCRIEIPSSVEKIGVTGFFGCKSLKEIVFSSDSHLRRISGFWNCSSLCRIEIPSSVEVIGPNAFMYSPSLRVIIIHAGSRLRRNEGLQNVRAFVVREDEYENMKRSRREVHLGIGERKVWDDDLDEFP